MRDTSNWACGAVYPKEPLPPASVKRNPIRTPRARFGSPRPAWPNWVGLAFSSPTPSAGGLPPFQQVAPPGTSSTCWTTMGGASVALALTRADPRSPRRGGTESRPLPPLSAVTQPRSCCRVPARGGKCEAPLRAQAKPNSPPPQTLSHWRIRGALGRRGAAAGMGRSR